MKSKDDSNKFSFTKEVLSKISKISLFTLNLENKKLSIFKELNHNEFLPVVVLKLNVPSKYSKLVSYGFLGKKLPTFTLNLILGFSKSKNLLFVIFSIFFFTLLSLKLL